MREIYDFWPGISIVGLCANQNGNTTVAKALFGKITVSFPFHWFEGMFFNQLSSPFLSFLGCGFVFIFLLLSTGLRSCLLKVPNFRNFMQGFTRALTDASCLKNWPYKGISLSFWNLGTSLRSREWEPSEIHCLQKKNLSSRADTRSEGTRAGQPVGYLQEGLGPSGGGAAMRTRGFGPCLSPGRSKASRRTSACGVTALRQRGEITARYFACRKKGRFVKSDT